jgi:hypothetical protein
MNALIFVHLSMMQFCIPQNVLYCNSFYRVSQKEKLADQNELWLVLHMLICWAKYEVLRLHDSYLSWFYILGLENQIL